MKSLLLAFFVMGLGCAVSGCGLDAGCTALGCTEGVGVTVKGVATKFMGALPLTLKSCADGGSCLTVKVSEAGGVFACEAAEAGTFADCAVTPAGDVTLDLAFETTATSDLSEIRVTVLDSAGATVFDGKQSTKLIGVEANGPDCGVTCHQGEVVLTP
jgi:hypothetical protein